MSDTKPAMAQSNFREALIADDAGGLGLRNEAEALAYADRQVERLAEAMRFSLHTQIKGLPGDDLELNTHEAIRHLIRNVNMGHASYMEADFLNPELTRMSATARIQFQLPSVDCQYHTALLHGDYTYRLQGNRGSACIFQIATYSGNAAELVNWKTCDMKNNFDAAQLAPGQEIDVVLSRHRPADIGERLWMEIPDGVCEMHLRQYYGDWEAEQPAELRIIREAQEFPAPILSRELAEARYNRLLNFLRVHAAFGRRGVQAHLDADPHDVPELVVPGAFEGTKYFSGHFRCDPEHAVIIEAEDPDTLYWNLELANLQWEPGDFWTRLTAYNSTQVHRYPDGMIRLVASWRDPGVPNWLDCSGRLLSLFAFRFFRPRRAAANPKVRIVPFAELRAHMPAGTPQVTPEQRHDLLTRRYLSFYRRRFGDF